MMVVFRFSDYFLVGSAAFLFMAYSNASVNKQDHRTPRLDTYKKLCETEINVRGLLFYVFIRRNTARFHKKYVYIQVELVY